VNNLLARFLRIFFRLLYGAFAWTYDFVANLVSIGRWKDWIRVVLPYLGGIYILELGHGPGHLQHVMYERGLVPTGIDSSRQMGKIAGNRLRQNGYAQNRLTRAEAQNLPFKDECFDTIFSTFPTEYFYDSHTLAEVRRTLKNEGRYVILPVAWITGNGFVDRVAAWLFRVTGQSPYELSREVIESLGLPFKDAGFNFQVELVDRISSSVLIVIASKQEVEL